MSSEYNYDPDAQFFPFFVITITAIITVPLTYSALRTSSDAASKNKAGTVSSSYQPHDAEIIEAQRTKQKRKERRLKRMLTAATGWLVMAWMAYLMLVTARTVPAVWDPFSILGVPMSASDADINRRYRRLSITMHPDKRTPNPALNETADAINDEWVEITKAYKSLTDEEVKRNWLEFGNPDGKQSTSFGIALPSILVADGSGKYVLLFYGALLGIGLPWLVGKWWYGSQAQTKDRILVTSAGSMFREWSERMDEPDVLAAVTASAEFRDILAGARADTGLGRLETRLQAADARTLGMLPKDAARLADLDDPARRKTLALLWAYLARLDLADKALEGDKYELAPTAQRMNEGFLSVCLAYGWTTPVLASYHLSQALMQAIPPATGRMPLLQLPHFTPAITAAIEKSTGSKDHWTVQSFMALPSEQRASLALAAGLSKPNLTAAEHVARQLPLLTVERAFFKVQGEKYIIPSSLIQFVIKARFIPPGSRNVPPVKGEDLLDPDPAEGDLDAQKKEPEQHPVPLAYAPYFARDRAPRWHVFLADTRQGKIAVPPFTFQVFDKKAFDGEGKPTFEVVTLKMQFAAPPQPGEYKFQMHMVCDAYLGFDHKQEVVLNIEDASKVEVESDDEISEPEEESLAGAMAALKGQPTADSDKPKKAPRKPAKPIHDESDYESSTDEDESSDSETDTDTDSDEE